MSNNLSITDQHLKNRYIVIQQAYFGASYKGSRVALALDGFGCDPNARGRGIYVQNVPEDTSGRINRSDVERFATEQEIAEAQEQGK